jgi:NTP pyrophosphatase (non-canonical NTP hydrolase)
MDEYRYNKVVDECKKLVISRNEQYGDSVDVVDIHTIVGLCMMKLTRVYQLGDKSKTKDELQDVLNYMVFALEKYEKEKEEKERKERERNKETLWRGNAND